MRFHGQSLLDKNGSRACVSKEGSHVAHSGVEVWLGVVIGATLLMPFAGAQFSNTPTRGSGELQINKQDLRSGQTNTVPNILVSKEADTAHVELMLAAGPDDLFLGTAIVISGNTETGSLGATCKTYSSRDGGFTWISSTPEPRFNTADPQVAFGSNGWAYFSALNTDHNNDLYFYRSKNGGESWEPGVKVGKGDHDLLVVDGTGGKFAGRTYLAIEDEGVVIYRSEDDGKTFLGPTLAVPQRSEGGENTLSPLVLSDGTLFVPYKLWGDAGNSVGFVTSSDGGVTFSQPAIIGKRTVGLMRQETIPLANEGIPPIVQGGGLEVFAVDSSRGPFRDYLYDLWEDEESNVTKLRFSYSADKGAHWSEPIEVFPSGSRGSFQFQPAIVVNREGVVGIQWYDTNGHENTNEFDAYFTSSNDGGKTFANPSRVSSETSHPRTPGNLRPSLLNLSTEQKGLRVAGMLSAEFVPPLLRWSEGGDYMGLVADSSDQFHLFWADSRGSTYQVYTAIVDQSLFGEKASSASARRDVSDITDKVSLVFGPVQQLSGDMSEIGIPVSIRNISTIPIYVPIVIEIKNLINGDGSNSGIHLPPPIIVNATNGKPGSGAKFSYEGSIGLPNSLPPNGVTTAVLWRFRFSPPVTEFSTHFRVDMLATGSTSR